MFDPVHFGHYRPALELAPLLELREIRLIPCRQPAHRPPPAAAAAHRLAMLRLVADGRRLIADDRELARAGVSYTCDTLRALRAEREGPLVLVLGADALAGVPDWHRARDIPGLCHLAAVERPGFPGFPALPADWQRRITRDPADLLGAQSGRIYLHAGEPQPCSSTWIRAQIAAGAAPRYCLPGGVWSYIRRHGLYGWRRAQGAP